MSGSSGFFVSGRVARAPHVLRKDGRVVALYTIACAGGYRDSSGTFQKRTDFIPLVSLGTQAEADATYLAKGKIVSVRGVIESWFDPIQRRGGITLKVKAIDYLSPSPALLHDETDAEDDDKAEQVAHDAWVADYCAAESS